MATNFDKFSAALDDFRLRRHTLGNQINDNRAKYAGAKEDYNQAPMDEATEAMARLDKEYQQKSNMVALLETRGAAGKRLGSKLE